MASIVWLKSQGTFSSDINACLTQIIREFYFVVDQQLAFIVASHCQSGIRYFLNSGDASPIAQGLVCAYHAFANIQGGSCASVERTASRWGYIRDMRGDRGHVATIPECIASDGSDGLRNDEGL